MAGRTSCKDAELIAIFVLLGLGLLGGGAAAIYEGLPYLVLERGFTQVIIGTVTATAGVILLALAWVLVEVRRIKAALGNATMALSMASLAGTPQPQAAPPTPQAPVPGAAEAVAGGIAVAGAAIAAASAFEPAQQRDEASPAGETAQPPDAEHDLFSELATEPEAREPASGLPGVDVETLPVFDPFRPVEPRDDPAAIPTVTAQAPEATLDALEAALPKATKPDEAVAEADDGTGEQPAADEAELGETNRVVADDEAQQAELAPASVQAADGTRGGDEFNFLRESLAGRLRELDLAETRVEPSLAPELASHDESWMEPSSRRREPWFEAPAASEPDQSAPDDDAPHWPPQTRERPAPEIESDPADEEGDDPVRGDQDAPAAEAVAVTPFDVPEPDAGAAESEPQAPAAEPDAAEPAASEEGIVGAYQVGNAHFTIYADGSIQARTPEGDYSFASMDELKVYLASEKNRLGV